MRIILLTPIGGVRSERIIVTPHQYRIFVCVARHLARIDNSRSAMKNDRSTEGKTLRRIIKVLNF